MGMNQLSIVTAVAKGSEVHTDGCRFGEIHSDDGQVANGWRSDVGDDEKYRGSEQEERADVVEEAEDHRNSGFATAARKVTS
jgi:hypothetical protein